MTGILSFPAFLLFAAATCLAELLASQPPAQAVSNKITDLSTRVRGAPRLTYSTGTTAGDGEEIELLDTLLMASVDGRFHAVNRTSGAILWSMSGTVQSNSVSKAASPLGPLVRTQHPTIGEDAIDGSEEHEVYVIEPQSGEIYVMSGSKEGPLQRLPFTVPQLVDMSPFSFPSEEDHRVFIGKKETSLLVVELETGRVKGSLCPWDPMGDLMDPWSEQDAEEEEYLDLDELEGLKPPRMKPTEVFIGRTDYHLSIRTKSSGPSYSRPPIQNLRFSIYGPNNQDNTIQSIYRHTPDNTYVESLPNGRVLSFRAAGGADIGLPRAPDLLWGHSFTSPIVAVFDVVKSQARRNPFVLLQPRPTLQDILPEIAIINAKRNAPPNHKSAYVGLVEDTGSLFVMSPDRYPLVMFGDSNVDDDHEIGRSIDPPSDDLDFPPNIDGIAQRTKLRKLCRSPTGSKDIRCFTGVRELEESSLSRLIDGVPGVIPPPQNPTTPDETPPSNTSIIPPPVISNRTPPGSGAPLLGDVTTQAFAAYALGALVLMIAVVWTVLRKQPRRKTEKTVIPVEQNGHVIPESISESPSVPEVHSQPATESTPRAEEVVEAHSSAVEPVIGPVPINRKVAFREDHSPYTPKNSQESEENGDAGDQTEAGETGDGDESEGDIATTPGRRKPARRKRGKKKKGGANGGVDEGGNSDEKLVESPANGDSPHGDSDEGIVHVVSPSNIVVPPTPKPIIPSLVVSDNILGFGSHGTVVFKGALQGRAVAVKRLLQDFVTLAMREVNILQESDDHPNVIRYYYQESHANFLYIALELCPASLADVVERPDQFRDISISFDSKRALRQITSGLRHLHALKIVHRDIKPQNILISHAKKGVGESAGHRMLISDFGLCKKLELDQTSFLPTAHGAMAAGTVGWRAPEILRGEVNLDVVTGEDSMSSRGSIGNASDPGTPTPGAKRTRLTKAVDIFALGCLFYYVLTNGSHPYGDRYERESNVLKDVKHLDGLERFGEEGSEAVNLIASMLSPEARDRPDTATCLIHPYFWDPGKRLNFLQDASDRFEIMCRDPKDRMLLVLETGAFEVVGADWNSRLDKFFIENLGKFRKYDGKSVQDLLRALRNKKHHYQDLPENVKRQVGPMPEGFLSYFTRRFPRLFLHVHSVIAASSLSQESMFRTYFELSDH